MGNDQPEVQADHFSYFCLRRLTLIGKQDLRISSLSHSGDTVYTVLPDNRKLNFPACVSVGLKSHGDAVIRGKKIYS